MKSNSAWARPYLTIANNATLFKQPLGQRTSQIIISITRRTTVSSMVGGTYVNDGDPETRHIDSCHVIITLPTEEPIFIRCPTVCYPSVEDVLSGYLERITCNNILRSRSHTCKRNGTDCAFPSSTPADGTCGPRVSFYRKHKATENLRAGKGRHTAHFESNCASVTVSADGPRGPWKALVRSG